MSGSSASTPPPPDPLTVGTAFVKSYYNVMSSNPEQITKFYQSDSVLSHGTGSDVSGILDSSAMAASRFRTDEIERFDFDAGAIDAQGSVNGGVLLVVTGQIVYEDSRRKAFVHTFFLSSFQKGVKSYYYVHNDILRFLHEEPEVRNAVAANNGTALSIPSALMQTTEATNVVVEEFEKKMDEHEPSAIATAALEMAQPTLLELHNGQASQPIMMTPHSVAELEASIPDPSPGRGEEETKEALLVEDYESEIKEHVAARGSGGSKPLGSWASLVAKNNSNGNKSAPASPNRPEQPTNQTPAVSPAKQQQPESPAPAATTATPATNTATKQPRAKRDPDCTLIIKNLDGKTTETEVLEVFEPFAKSADATVIGCTVQANRGIAFVDYDSPEPVLKALQVADFTIRERKLEIYQKTVDQKNRGSRGGGRQVRGGGRSHQHARRGSGRNAGRGRGGQR